VDSKLPLVGHVLMLDLAHIIHSCLEPLPKDVNEFRAQVQKYFPTIVDTKLLQPIYYSINKKPLESAIEIVKKNLPYPVVNEILTVEDNTSADMMLNSDRAASFVHNAGWDAYLSGFLFAKLFVYRTNHPKFRRHNFQSFSDTQHIAEYTNRLFLIRSAQSLNVDDYKQESYDIESFFVLRHLPSSKVSHVHQAFPELRPNNIHPLDKENAIIRLSNMDQETHIRSKVKFPTEMISYREFEQDLCFFIETQGHWKDKNTHDNLLALRDQQPSSSDNEHTVEAHRRGTKRKDQSTTPDLKPNKRRRVEEENSHDDDNSSCVIQ